MHVCARAHVCVPVCGQGAFLEGVLLPWAVAGLGTLLQITLLSSW